MPGNRPGSQKTLERKREDNKRNALLAMAFDRPSISDQDIGDFTERLHEDRPGTVLLDEEMAVDLEDVLIGQGFEGQPPFDPKSFRFEGGKTIEEGFRPNFRRLFKTPQLKKDEYERWLRKELSSLMLEGALGKTPPTVR